MLGAALTVLERENSVRVDFTFEAFEELLTGGRGVRGRVDVGVQRVRGNATA
jgi:hypothetical protein